MNSASVTGVSPYRSLSKISYPNISSWETTDRHFTVNNSIAVAGRTRTAKIARRGSATVEIEAAICSSPDPALPVSADRQVTARATFELKPLDARRIARLRCDPRVDGLRAPIRDAQGS